MSSSFLNWLAPRMIKLLGRLPLSVGRSLGAALGAVSWWTQGRSARVTLRNLELCFADMPLEERQQLAKQSLKETGKTIFEAAQVWVKPQAWLDQHTQVGEGLELIKDAEDAGKGILFMTPHLGNWEVTSRWFAGYSDKTTLTAMYLPGKLPALDNLVREAREKSGCKLVPASLKGVMAQIKTLKKGQAVGLLPDQNPDEGAGDFAPFFGQPALTMTLAQSFIDRTGCAVIMALAERTDRGWKLSFRAPEKNIYSDNAQESLAEMNATIERMVEPIKAQYQWEYKRFKRQPNGENLYAKASSVSG